jgi:hypothetical protein
MRHAMNHSILTELARALTKDEFVARLPDPVLIVMSELEPEEASGEDDTQVGDTLRGTPGVARKEVPSQFESLAVRKKRHAADRTRISLGRDRTCDIVVRTPGVSKQHACFLFGPGLTVVDLGSQNGTFVDGIRLPPEQPTDVRAGQTIVFGDLVTRLVTPVELYALLKSTRS